MKIAEILETTNARVSRVQGDKVTIDHGDGTETTIDTRKNPDALNQDEKGNLSVNRNTGNSAMKKRQQQQRRPRPGQQVTMNDEN